MLFEVYKENKCMFSTDHKECIPDKDILKSMNKSGYTFKLKGKKINLKTLVNQL